MESFYLIYIYSSRFEIRIVFFEREMCDVCILYIWAGYVVCTAKKGGREGGRELKQIRLRVKARRAQSHQETRPYPRLSA